MDEEKLNAVSLEMRKVFANNLKQARHRLNLSQDKLSEISGVHKFTILKIEKLQMTPTIDVMVKLSLGLGCCLFELLMPDDETDNAPTLRLASRK